MFVSEYQEKITCAECGNVHRYFKDFIYLSENDELMNLCSDCFNRKSTRRANIDVKGYQGHAFVNTCNDHLYYHTTDTSVVPRYFSSKDKLENYLLKTATYKTLIDIHNIKKSDKVLMFEPFNDGKFSVSRQFMLLIKELAEKFELDTDFIRERYIDTIELLKCRALYLRNDEYYYFLPANRTINSLDELETKGVKSKNWNKLFTALFDTVDSQLLEKLSRYAKNRVISIEDLVRKIQVTSDIYDIYCNDDINSCMTGETYVKFYEKIRKRENDIQVAYMMNESNELIGRALLWNDLTDEENEEVFKLIDRIYTRGDSEDEITQAFKLYAKQNGYYHRTNQDFGSKTKVTNLEGETGYKYLSYECKDEIDSYDEYPYVDTLSYAKGRILSNDESNVLLTLTNTDGSYEGYGVLCEHCGRMVAEGETVGIQGYGCVCNECINSSELFYYCNHCETYHYENYDSGHLLHGGTHNGAYICSYGADQTGYVLDYNGDYRCVDDLVCVENDKEYYPVHELDGGILFQCAGTDNIYLKDDTEYVVTVTGDYHSEHSPQYDFYKEIEKEARVHSQLIMEGVEV